MRKEIRKHYIVDVDCTIEVEIMSRAKDVFDWMDEYIENLQYDWFDPTNDSFEILYKDGASEYIDSDYDGRKIRRKNIKSIIYNNPEDYIVFGEYKMNEFGVVHAAQINNQPRRLRW